MHTKTWGKNGIFHVHLLVWYSNEPVLFIIICINLIFLLMPPIIMSLGVPRRKKWRKHG